MALFEHSCFTCYPVSLCSMVYGWAKAHLRRINCRDKDCRCQRWSNTCEHNDIIQRWNNDVIQQANSYASLYKSKRFGEQQSSEIQQYEPQVDRMYNHLNKSLNLKSQISNLHSISQARHMNMLYEGRDSTGTYGNSSSNIALTGAAGSANSSHSPRR